MKIELKVLVGVLFCELIVWLPYNGNGNAEIRIVVTLSRSCHALRMVELKIPLSYMDCFDHMTSSEGVKFVFGFTNKFFPVARDALKYIPMEGLGSKPLRIYLESAKDVYMYISLLIDDKVANGDLLHCL